MRRTFVAASVAGVVAAFGPSANALDLNDAQQRAGEMQLSQLTPGHAPESPKRQADPSAVTTVSSPHPIVGVLVTMGKEYLGPEARWKFGDKIGQSIMAQYDKLAGELSKFGKIGQYKDGKFVNGEGDYFDVAFDVGDTVANSNGLLSAKKFSIQLDKPGMDDAVSASATLVIKENWARQGEKTHVTVRKAYKPAAFIRGASFIRSTKHPYLIAKLETVGKDGKHNSFYVTPYDGKFPTDSATAVLDKALEISGNLSLAPVPAFEGVVFPKASYKNVNKTLLKPGIVYAAKAERKGVKYEMGQFLFEQKIKIHEKGISLEAAAAGGAVRASAPIEPDTSKAFVIDDSYLFWIDVNGAVPFAGLITPNEMQEPPRD